MVRCSLSAVVIVFCGIRVASEDARGKESGPCTMHTYFDEGALSNGGVSLKGQQATLQAWTKAWKAAGWETRILDEQYAKTHPDYYTLRAKFEALPTVNPKKYEVSCFMRHVAMASVGGGWMCDYDVVPVHMPRCLSLPNNERFTTHESHIPSMVSGSADEYTRVAHLLGNVPWSDSKYSKEFTTNGRPHVSDMVALQFISNAHDINSGARGCGVVSPEKILISGQCQTCKYGGAPFAVHFAHSEMDKMHHLYSADAGSSQDASSASPTPKPMLKLKLNCSTMSDSYSHWNSWRAACLVEASKVLRDHCSRQAREILAAGSLPSVGGEVHHKEESCHEECGGEPGACSEFCGPGGACCRRGFLDAKNDPACGFGTLGCDHRHCCVGISQDATAASASSAIISLPPPSAPSADSTASSMTPYSSSSATTASSSSSSSTASTAASSSSSSAAVAAHSPTPPARAEIRTHLHHHHHHPLHHHKAPVRSEELCSRGIVGSEDVWPVCCGKSCGACGGLGCNARPGGVNLCCAGRIMRSDRRCEYPDQVGCVMPLDDPFTALAYVAPAFEMSEDLAHIGESCHAECNGEAGTCSTDFCGRAGACCRRGFDFDKDEAACGFGALGCADNHCCVAAAPPKPEEIVLKNEGSSCHHECDGQSGPCIKFCGGGGSCCRLGFEDDKDEPSCGFGVIGCEGSHCCVASAQ